MLDDGQEVDQARGGATRRRVELIRAGRLEIRPIARGRGIQEPTMPGRVRVDPDVQAVLHAQFGIRQVDNLIIDLPQERQPGRIEPRGGPLLDPLSDHDGQFLRIQIRSGARAGHIRHEGIAE